MFPSSPSGALVALAFIISGLMAAFPLTSHASPATGAARYVDVYEYLQGDAQFEAWYRVTSGLQRDFDEVCGDTFCEGDYSNIQPLRFRCSVDRVNGRIGQCLWVLAGSHEEIDPATGSIVVTAKVWRCLSPIGRLTKLEELLAALDRPSPIRVALPGSGRSIYDGLVDCL